MPTNKRTLTALLAALAAGAAAAATPPAPPDPPGHFEMATYYLVLLRRPPHAPQLSPAEAERLQAAHLANIRAMGERKQLLLAGPFADDTDLRGVFVLTVGSLDEARALVDADPLVKAGRLVGEIHPWFAAKNIRVTPHAEAPCPGTAEGAR